MARVRVSARANTAPMRRSISAQYTLHAWTANRSRSGTGVSTGVCIYLHLREDMNCTEVYNTITTTVVLGPVGPIKATTLGPIVHPRLDGRRPCRRNMPHLAWRPVDLETGQPMLMIL